MDGSTRRDAVSTNIRLFVRWRSQFSLRIALENSKHEANTESHAFLLPRTLNFTRQPVPEYATHKVFGQARVNTAAQTETDAGVCISIQGLGHPASQSVSEDLESLIDRQRQTEPRAN